MWRARRRAGRFPAGGLRVGLVAVFLAVFMAVLFAALGARPAGAETGTGGEQVDEFRADYVLRGDGTLEVTETITYRFPAGQARHGIFRYIPERVRYDDTHDRVFPISDVQVSAQSAGGGGDPTRAGHFETYTENDNKVIKIGDPDSTVNGVWRYTIDYVVGDTVEPVRNDQASVDELVWNVTGDGWSVPIETASARFELPAAPLATRCFSGTYGSTQTCPLDVDGDTVSSPGTALAPGEGLTLAIDLPPGSVPGAQINLVERWSMERAFEVTPLKAGLAALLTAAIAGGLTIGLGRHARDRRLVLNAYLPADADPDRAGLVHFFEKADGPVRFRPPEGATPGLVGVVLDEKADTLDVSATLVDLAVRGYLRIEELGDTWGRAAAKDDFRLVRLRDPDGELLDYERDLLSRLWAKAPNGAAVTLGELRTTFSGDLGAVRQGMYQEVQKRGWFVRRPDRVRVFWYVIGVLLLGVGLLAAVAVAAASHWGLLAIPLVAPGLIVVLAAHRMPARTGAGRKVLEEAVGYERFLDVADADQLRFQEQQLQFIAALPYAMVFGLTRKWAQVLAVLQEQGLNLRPTWYVPYDPMAPFRFYLLGTAISNFSSASGSALSVPAPSHTGGGFGGGGGFAGGGGGGGGGGSW
jgi:uncharacterized membrane protein YgcG